jgi:hypothetical protein
VDAEKRLQRVGGFKSIAMKFLFSLMLSVLSLCGSAQTSDNTLLQEFLESPDYAAIINNSPFGKTGTADLKQSFVVWATAGSGEIQKQVPLIYLQFTGLINGKKKLLGQIHAIKVKEGYNGLPRNGKYLMLYKDLRQFNAEEGTGSIRVYDLNYDEYLVGEAVLGNGTLSQYTPYPVPEQVAAKYNLAGRQSLPCTSVGGTTTFGECFSCMIGSCVLNPDCRALCLLAGSLQWQCTRSIQLYCAMIAMVA